VKPPPGFGADSARSTTARVEQMAYVINDRCTQCGECLDVCPIGSISAGDPKYVIDDTCCDFAECVVVCPVEAIIPLDAMIEEADDTGAAESLVADAERGSGAS